MAIIISLGGLVLTMGTSMMAPALPKIGADLHLGSSATQLALSIYVLAQGIGPLLIAPFSEMYGRKPVWIICSLWYILWNTLCPVNKTKGLMIAGRFMSGMGASVGIAVSFYSVMASVSNPGRQLNGPTMADIYKAEHRGFSFAISTFAPYLGAAIGPIIGGYVSQEVGWPWLFWVVSIFDAVLVILGAAFFHESYAPVLLARKSKRLRASTGIDYRTKFERTHPTVSKKLKASLSRPMKLLATRPIIHVIGLLLAYNFGVYCLALSTFATLWTGKYHESTSTSGLNYIAIALGSTIASQAGASVTDRIWAHLKAKAGGTVSPEYRAPLMLPGAVLMGTGLFWYGWSAERHAVWIMPDIGICLFSCGMMLQAQALLAYLIDEFSEQAASANAASRILSNIMGFTFPIFAPQLYANLGYGWGNSLLAFMSLGMGLPAPLILWKHGSRLRAMGQVDSSI